MSTPPQALTVKGRRRREDLLTATLKVIAERGYAGASQRVIAQAAGVSPASTHYFFTSMEELAREAAAAHLSERVAAYRGLINELTTQGQSIGEILAQVVAVLEAVSEDRRLAQFEIYLNAARQPALAETVGECLTQLLLLAEQVLAACGVPDPAAWSPAVLALGDGFALQRVAGRPATAADFERALHALVLTARMTAAESEQAERTLAEVKSGEREATP